jgi:NosR/NirI family nitrous oxide reductase transcriptional regulator
VLYQSATKCPVCIKKESKREKFRKQNLLDPIAPAPAGKGQPLVGTNPTSQPTT